MQPPEEDAGYHERRSEVLYELQCGFELIINLRTRFQVINMPKQYEVLSCPFCHKGQIQCVFFPGAWSEKRSGRNSLGRGVSVSKSTETWIVQSGCNICGKSQQEVEKQLRKDGFA